MTSVDSRGSRPDLPGPASSRDEAIGLLAPALGEEKASDVVLAAASALGISGDEWTTASTRALFDHIAKEPGLVGITARVVTRRLRLGGAATSVFDAQATAPQSAAAGAPAALPTVESAATTTPGKPWESVSDLLVHALGEAPARSAVQSAVQSLGLGRSLSYADALQVLELIAREPGVVGIAARFAKTRLHLLSW